VAEEVVVCINDSIGQARAISRGLFPVELSAGGLVAALREFAAETTKRSGIECRLEADKRLLIRDTAVALHLFRLVQEAVSNAIRHGEARHIAIHLVRTGDRILVEIRDDGKGLPARQPVGRGLGFRTMKYRAGIIGAQFAVESANGHGTVVSCLVPLKKSLPPRSD
jgi:signal transduction histidine kinase